MKIVFLTDPLDQFKTYKDSTFAMMREADSRGHQLFAFGPDDMALEGGVVVANVRRITLTGDAHDWYRAEAPQASALSAYDAVIQRKDPPFDMEYIYATYLLELAEQQGARVFNKPAAIRNHNEKLSIAQFSQFTTPTLVTRDEQRIRAFHQTHQDIILKPLDGMGGAGIFRIRDDGMNLGSVIETLTLNGARTIMVQRYIAEIVHGDKRILLIGGKVVPFALARIPQNGEVRGNLAAGGVGVAQELTARDLEIAETLAPILYQRGLLLVGLDVIGHYLTEVNVTSPTCFQEITQQKGFNVAGMFIDALESAI
ncbi:glutathione synthase [Undibacterium sp. RTI2.1]|uniref:glutathione synthase n=1 Tax=unclassified Undibacterium TaxID=2630295 RepID=UPI002AB4768A|nr:MULTISPECIES: glutathione synthase [unclassified Undibacterium]MDY7539924.1 glutathione synthase [Undibacterium sp. 5I1]MEB0031165.1 glutathione synthase [Undibacterium sp. RTI2.1]MEB0116435.1 glutathione synthase [Undibacterium sp. RTI2.2]MEB0230531.1 glutathione synthase [Undibacterium sp. 10I3]MEB0257229.1 glutathione synthase [Undibacterium sp. 5I1]